MENLTNNTNDYKLKLITEFENVCNKVKDIKKLSNEDKLKFYGLFKVATEGKFDTENEKELGYFDFEKKAKYGAWKKFSYLKNEEAMIEYIHFYNKITNTKLSSEVEECINRIKNPSDTNTNYKLNNKSDDNNIDNLTNLVDEKLVIEGIDNLEEIDGENIQPFQFSSTAKQTKDEIVEYLKNASNDECAFYEIQTAFHEGKKIDKAFFKRYFHLNCKNWK